MCNFSLDGPWPLGDSSCCRRVGTARPPHSVFPPPALMSPFHYCAAIHHAHGQGDFAGTCVCVGDVAQAIITGDKAHASALPGQGPRFACSNSHPPGCLLLCSPGRWRGARLVVLRHPGQQHSTGHTCVAQPKPCLSHPGRRAGQASALSLAVSQMKDVCASQTLPQQFLQYWSL